MADEAEAVERSDASRLLDLIGDAPIQFWTCATRHPREPMRETVRWNGPVATCMDCGRTNADANADHRPVGYDRNVPLDCRACGWPWPCPTYEALPASPVGRTESGEG